MNTLKEIEKLSDKLKVQRDEIELKLHLASMDAKKEWEKAEDKWSHFKDKLEDIGDETKETTEEFVAATKVVGEELKTAYQNIVKRLSD